MSDLECRKCGGGGVLTVPDGDGESASEQACPDPVHDGTVTATPGQALSPDPADFAYHVRATAFNVLTGKMAGDEWHVPRSERDAIARAVVDAVEPLIRADERALAAQEPHAAPASLAGLVDAHLFGDGPHPLQLVCLTENASDVECDTEIALVEPGATWADLDARIVAHAAECHAAAQPQPAPELAAAMTESRALRAVITEILDAFSPSGSGHTARVGQVQIAKWRTRAGLTS